MTPDRIAELRTDLLEFNRHMFRSRKGVDMMMNTHFQDICNALERVVIGDINRLIINMPPRAGKTETAVKNFMAWCMGNWPHSHFIHASYSKRLATSNTYEVRAIMQHEEYTKIFAHTSLADDSKAKDEFRTGQGGIVYATGAEGTITGYGAGGMDDTFAGCFAYHQEIKTELGDMSIGDIVNGKIDVRVWSYDESSGKERLSKISRYWKNPANDIIRIAMSDGSHIDCTPDHEILTKAGWVSAIHFAKALNLVDGEASQLAGIRPTDASVDGDLYDAVRVLWLCVPNSIRKRLRNRLPCLPGFDLTDDPRRNAITLCEDGSAFRALEYLNDFFSGEFCAGTTLKQWECPVPDSVLHIVGLSAIRQIAQVIIGGVSVEMSNLIPVGAFTYKLLSNQVRDVASFNFSANRQVYPEIPLPVVRRLQKSDGLCPSDLSGVRNLIQPEGIPNVFPVGVFYAGHVDATYCLEVEDDNNFIVSQNGAIVSNCIIIDDPHKAGEGDSDLRRESVLEWFQTTMESRKNNVDTPIIIIMQRLHENDLSGWLLDGGNGEHWDHLNIEAITSEGESFWEEKFPLSVLERMEKANPYVFAGQYMQNPTPRSGGDFKVENIKIVDALPSNIKLVRGWDLAATTKKRSDYTATVALGVCQDGYTWIADVDRFKGTPDEVENSIKYNADVDGKDVFVSIPQDPGQAGVAQKNNFSRLLAGYSFEITPETGDKRTRAAPLAAQVNAGNVRMLKSSWNKEFSDELRVFPNGANDDQVDAASRAYNKAFVPKKSPAGLLIPSRLR